MSTIDFSNSKVLKNYSLAQAREGKGEILIKTNVICFRNDQGIEYVIPDEHAHEFKDRIKNAKKIDVAEQIYDKEEKNEDYTIEDMREAYKAKHDKDVPLRFKNDIQWIASKL